MRNRTILSVIAFAFVLLGTWVALGRYSTESLDPSSGAAVEPNRSGIVALPVAAQGKDTLPGIAPGTATVTGAGSPILATNPKASARETIPPAADGTVTLGGPGFTAGDLPDCRFARELAALPPQPRAKALAQLQAKPIPRLDLNSLHVDVTGRFYYTCAFPTPKKTPSTAPVVAHVNGPQAAPVPVSPFPNSLKFHSNFGSTKVIYIDFSGGLVKNTMWDGEPAAGWNCHAFSADADETTFNDAEQGLIKAIWERVAEDYAPFDVDVTTEAPAQWTSTTAHAMVTKDVDRNGVKLPHKGAGGVAYVDVWGIPEFSYNSSTKCYSPAWVTEYTNSLYSAEAASHEIGHNLSLNHDGTATDEYYSGHPIVPGDIHDWNAIMGGGVIADISQWSKGEYFGASNTKEDDLKEISDRLGYRTPDAGSTDATATPLAISGISINQKGRIETNATTDVYSFVSGAGPLSITAAVYKYNNADWGTNLDINLELYGPGGVKLASANPGNDSSASLNYTIPTSGAYFIHVSGSANGTPLSNPPTGYTSYGSLGQYTLTGTLSSNVQEIALTGNGSEIINGDFAPGPVDGTDFGVISAGPQVIRTYTIQNIGGGTLNLTGTPLVSLVGDGAFVVTSQPGATSIPAGSALTFSVGFTAASAGVHTTLVNIPNNDGDENPYQILLRATCKAQDLQVYGNQTLMSSGDLTPSIIDQTDFGVAPVSGSSIVRSFTISNKGLGALHLTAPVTVSGSQAKEFTITGVPDNTIGANASTSLQITFKPTDNGVRRAIVTIPSDDTNTPAFTFAIQGIGSKPGFTILSWNVNGLLDQATARASIVNQRPDVVFLMDELDGSGTVSLLRDELLVATGNTYGEYSPVQANASHPVKFLSRFPMTAQEDLGDAAHDPTNKILNSVPKADITVDGEVFHLVGVYAQSGASATAQKSEIDAILANIQTSTGNVRTVMLGDLAGRAVSDGAVHATTASYYATDGWGYYNTASTDACLVAGYRDAWRLINPSRAVQPTKMRAYGELFSPFGGMNQNQRVDFTLVSSGLVVKNAGICTEVTNAISDHKPVWVQLGTSTGATLTQGGLRMDTTPEIIGSTLAKDGSFIDVQFSEGVYADAAMTKPLTLANFEAVVETYGVGIPGTGMVTSVLHTPGSATARVFLTFSGALTLPRSCYLLLAGGNYQAQNKVPVHIYNAAGVSDVWTRLNAGAPVAGTIRTNAHRLNSQPTITQGSVVSVIMSEDSSPTPFVYALNAMDGDGDVLAWSISTPASHGIATASSSGNSCSVGYIPSVNYNGVDSFIVQVADDRGGSARIIVNVTLQAVNDAPIALGQAVSTAVGAAKNITLAGTDVDGTIASYNFSQPAHGTLTGTGSVLLYTPVSNYSGSDSFTYTVTDNLSAVSTPATVNIGVVAAANQPLFTSSNSTSVAENQTAVQTVIASTTASDIITYSVVGGVDKAKFAIHPTSGILTFVTAPDFELPGDFDLNNSYVVVVQAAAGVGVTSQTITVTVTNVPDGQPKITWVTPNNINYGTALDSFQLNATANVAGTFSYSPAAGTVLSPGLQTLSVTFTPTNTTTYVAVNATVQIQVDIPAVDAFVFRFYQQCLSRNPDTAGLKDWVDGLKSGKRSGADVARGFVMSQEFANRALGDLDFLTVLYRAFFNRDPDAGGLATWQAELTKGSLREDVLYGFVFAQEFANLCNSFTITPIDEAGQRTYQLRQFTRRFYQQCLNREPDAGGIASWTQALVDGTALGDSVAKGFVLSPEFTNRGVNDNQFLDILYRAFFDREADTDGKNLWLSQLGAGVSRSQVLNGFLASQEFANLCAKYKIIPFAPTG